MKIAADFSKREIVHSRSLPWTASPMKGVDRRPLDRVGDEVARATTIVRYAAGSKFSPHVHTGGEEFIVLEGVFQDEHGDFPAGSYVRNPPQSSHTPRSDEGCIIMVKLWQFQPDDRLHVSIDLHTIQKETLDASQQIETSSLYKDAFEDVSLLHIPANAIYSDIAQGGIEFFVLEGSVTEQKETLTQYSWLRLPMGTSFKLIAGNEGAKVWIKKGHLIDVDKQIMRVNNSA